MDDIRDQLIYLLETEEFQAYYKKHLLPLVQVSSSRREQNDYGFDFLETHLEKLKIPECHISILGVQGAGKSSLLNALIFADEVLPVEVEETTCIPTMIRRIYPGESEGLEIHYANGDKQAAPLKKEFLEKVVDNKYNPGNVMDVKYVICRVNRDFLKEGFVFVDLPGVGSLTAKNEETTMHFLQNTHMGIFLLRTVPPITESEAGFIHLAWPRLQESLFVQNLWARETASEVESGKEHNIYVLKHIANERGTGFPTSILPVNVAMACQASYTNNKQGMAESGLDALIKQLRQHAKKTSWHKMARKTAIIFASLVHKSQLPLRERLRLINADKDALKAKWEECNEQRKSKQEGLQEKLNKLCDDFFHSMDDLKLEDIAELLDEGANRVLERMDKMPLEDMREDDFRQEVRTAFGEEFSFVYQKIRAKMAECAEEYVQNLGEILKDVSRSGALSESLEDKARSKSASGWSVVLSGSIAPLVVGGPVGWGILGGAMVVGGLVRWISGASAHNRILRGVKKVINDGKLQVRRHILDEIDEFTEKVAASLRESIEQELETFSLEMDRVEQDLASHKDDHKDVFAELEQDIEMSNHIMEALNHLKNM